MTLLARRLPHSAQRVPKWAVLASVPVVLAVLAIGVWVAGAALTQNASLAKVFTGAWFLGAGLVALVVAVRWRALALPVLVTYAVGVAAIGGFLLYTSSVNRVVNERVVVAQTTLRPSAATAAPRAATPGGPAAPAVPAVPTAPVAIAAGAFTAGAHPTTGTATLIKLPDGRRVLTLTSFATNPGPDLRVLLVAGNGSSTAGSTDLGALKGNQGNQQYNVPQSAPAGAVVIWCRAFTVTFGSARLA